MNTLEKYLDLAERHARMLVANRGEQSIKTLKSRFRALNCYTDQSSRLYAQLLRDGYSRAQLFALYNERCAGIVGREAQP